jgi:hypothetical protein
MKMEKKFSDFDPKKDIRLSSFGHLLTTINSTILTLTYFCQYLMKKEWWFAYISESYSESTIVKKVNRYSWYGRASLFHFSFSTFESTTRLILRALDSSACKNGTAEFKSIYSCLLRNKLSEYPESSLEFVDLLRCIRNTIHNNGIYFHHRFQQEQVVWKRKKYNFIFGQPVAYTNWDFCLLLVDEMRKLLEIIIDDENVKTIDMEITDPMAVIS